MYVYVLDDNAMRRRCSKFRVMDRVERIVMTACRVAVRLAGRSLLVEQSKVKYITELAPFIACPHRTLLIAHLHSVSVLVDVFTLQACPNNTDNGQGVPVPHYRVGGCKNTTPARP